MKDHLVRCLIPMVPVLVTVSLLVSVVFNVLLDNPLVATVDSEP